MRGSANRSYPEDAPLDVHVPGVRSDFFDRNNLLRRLTLLIYILVLHQNSVRQT